MTARQVACEALVRIEAGAYSHVLVPQLLREHALGARDRAFATELVYGTVRAQRRLDWLLAGLSTRRLEDLDPPVRAALRLGAYQLLNGVARHAAVGETVAVVRRSARGYVNAVLRGVSRLGPPWPEPTDLDVALSYPTWLVERLSADLGVDDARAALVASNEPAAVTLRPNRREQGAEGLAAELMTAGVECTPGTLVPEALVVRRIGDPAALPSIARGRATPQDQASQAVVGVLLAASPSPPVGGPERILDVAAAPGGKATGIAERVAPGSLVVAADLHRGRLGLVRTAAARLHLDDLVVVQADGSRPPFRDASFDRVLVDAPCSGLGVLRRRPDARWRLDPGTLASLAALQRRLLTGAAVLVRPGGLLVYSVCTLTRVETVDVVAAATDALAGFVPLAPPPPPWRPLGPGAILLPQDAGTDGMFVVGWRRDD